ncbi:MAG: hypothetical protein H7Y31_10760 [Chitinophagaceae bacterium]|nr:hypothetical protein [Chitinophagaceae bacterium]
MQIRSIQLPVVLLVLIAMASCESKQNGPSKEAITAINLKRGNVIVCGPAEKQFGAADFPITAHDSIKKEFNLAISLLHSFEYDEAEKVFASIIDKDPSCAMAYWGVAMSNYHPLWAPPSETELKKGAAALEIAQSIENKTKREIDYINALSAFYNDWSKSPHRARSIQYEKAMEKLYADYKGDKETAIFYSLALDASADPADKTFVNQKKAAVILNALYPNEPNHPGIAHYIIHTYDYPEVAELALPMARKYATIAPSSSHALHMPSHIFTRLGLWSEAISSNKAAAESARCYAESVGIKGAWDEELHALDYLMYAFLQKSDNDNAKAQWDYVRSIPAVSPMNFKVAYSFAAIPARYTLENKIWDEASNLELYPSYVPWKNFPWQEAIVHFARAIGSVNLGHLSAAREEASKLAALRDTLIGQKDAYKANQVDIQLKSVQAWILLTEGKKEEAIQLMRSAADMEDKTEKHAVTPGEILPAKELLGDMYMELAMPAEALAAYEANLKQRPNRYNSLIGAARSAEKLKQREKAHQYRYQLEKMLAPSGLVKKL